MPTLPAPPLLAPTPTAPAPRPCAEALEERLLYAADLAPAAIAAAADALNGAPDEGPVLQRVLDTPAAVHASATGASDTWTHHTTQARGAEIVFIDAAVPDAPHLLADLQAQRAAGRDVQAVWIAADQDGLAVIGSTLAARADLAAVHIVAHGEPGALQIGSTRLDGATLLQRAAEVAAWGDALGTEADLLLYGCELAAQPAGQALLADLAALTGADVAASTDATGSALRGGDWTLEAATGAIQAARAFSAEAEGHWAGLLASPAPSSTGTAVWAEAGYSSPQTGAWDGLSLSAAQQASAVTAGWVNLTGAASATRDELILAGVDANGVIRAQMWNGSAWAEIGGGPLGTASVGDRLSVAVAYEKTGDAVLVWDNGSGLSYQVWNGSSWTAAQAVAAYTGAEPQHLQLVSNPVRDEMILVVSDAAADDRALVWNGSTWGSRVLLDASNSARLLQTSLAVAYESLSGHALVAWAESGDPNVYYSTWNGTQWSSANAASDFDDDDASLVPQYIKLASDPRSDRIALAVTLTDGSSARQAAFALWSGSGWSSLALPASGNDIGSAADVAFDSRSGTLLAVYQGSDNKLQYRTHTAAGGWSAEAAGPDVGNKPMALDLVADAGSSRIMLAAQRVNGSIAYVAWDGGAWDSASLREVGSTAGNTSGAQPFGFIWSRYTAPKTHTLWVSPDATSSSPGWSGVNRTADSALLELGPSGLQYGSSSAGTLRHLLDLRALASGGNAAAFGLDDVVLVSRDLTLAGGVQLKRGDILFSTDLSVTLTGNSALASNGAVTADANDVLIYRPDAAGDLSRGQVVKLIDAMGSGLLGGAADIQGLALVEQATTIAGQSVAAGTLLFTVGDSRVLRYAPTGVLLGLLTGNTSVLLDASAVGVDAGIRALEVVSAPVTLPGGVSLAAGSLLLALNGADGAIGSNGQAAQQADVIALHATSTSAATAQIVVDGSDLGAGSVAFDALALSLDAAPVITSHGGAASVALSQAEGAQPVLTTVTATDAEGSPLTFSLAGADAGRFTLDSQGRLRFASAPDHEAPADADGDNVYQVSVRVSDGTETREQAFAVTVTDVNEAPQITSAGGAAYAALDHPAGGTAVTTVTASDADAGSALSWQIVAGLGDAALFSIDAATGALSFNSPPAVVPGGDNTYDVTVRVSDGSLSDEQRLSITVTQGSPPIAFAGGAAVWRTVAEGQRDVTVLLASGGSGPLSYLLTGGDADRFEIVTVGSDTVLRFIQPPDFEAGDGRTSFAVVVQASDGSDSATQSVMVQVQDVQPTLALPAGPLAGLEDQPLPVAGLQIGSDDVAASDTVALTLSVGQGRLQVAAGSGVSLAGNGQASVTLSGTRADINALLASSGALSFLPAADASGSETLQAQLTAPGGAAAASVALSVAAANDAPVAGAPLADAPAQAGQPFRLDLPAGAFTDVDAADSLRYALTLGNGQPAPGWLSVSATTGRLQGTPGAADAGTLDLILIATDDGGAQATQALRIVVSPAPPPPPPQPAPPEPAPPPLVLPPALPAEPATADSATPAAESGTDAPQDSSMEAAATGSPAPAGPAPASADAALAPAPAWLAGLDVAPPAAGRGMAFELRDWRVDPPPAGTLLPAAWAAAGLPDWQGSSLTPLAQAVQSASLSQALDTLHQQLTEQVIEHRQAIASSIAVTTGLSVGYVIWLVRGGVLLGSMLSAMPAWQMIDPLPVLTRSRGGPGAGTDGGEPADDVDALFDGDARAGAAPAGAPSRAPAAVSQAGPAAARPTPEAVR
jgi:hypothetical protein